MFKKVIFTVLIITGVAIMLKSCINADTPENEIEKEKIARDYFIKNMDYFIKKYDQIFGSRYSNVVLFPWIR